MRLTETSSVNRHSKIDKNNQITELVILGVFIFFRPEQDRRDY